MKQPHEHIADAYQGRTGSPFQSDRAFRSKRFPPGATIIISLLLAPLAWLVIFLCASAVFQ